MDAGDQEVGCLDAGVRYESCAIGGGGGRRGIVVVITEEHSVLLPDGLLCPKRRRRAGWRRRSDGGGDWVVEGERRRGERAGEEEAPTHQGAVRLPRGKLQGAQHPQPETEACSGQAAQPAASTGGSLVSEQKSQVLFFLLHARSTSQLLFHRKDRTFVFLHPMLGSFTPLYKLITARANNNNRTKLKQTEVDCEYLRRCCQTLTEENRRLQKEVAELRALKTSRPFYMHVPATTLSMCPACERVASTTTTTTIPTAPATPSDDHRPNSFAALFSKPGALQSGSRTARSAPRLPSPAS